MMSDMNGQAVSAKHKAMVVLAGVGIFWLTFGILAFLSLLLPLNPPAFLWVETADVSVLSPRAFLSYLAVLLAAIFAGWSLPNKGWAYGVVTSVCTQLPAVGPSFITMSRLSLDLLRNPDMIYQGPGVTPLWLVTVLMPLVVAVALGAMGGFCGQWLHQRLRRQAPTAFLPPTDDGESG